MEETALVPVKQPRPETEEKMAHYLATRLQYATDDEWLIGEGIATAHGTIQRWVQVYPEFAQARRQMLRTLAELRKERMRAVVDAGVQVAATALKPDKVAQAMQILQDLAQDESLPGKVRVEAARGVLQAAAQMFARVMRGAERLAPEAGTEMTYEERVRVSLKVTE